MEYIRRHHSVPERLELLQELASKYNVRTAA
jgi:hypothetical protein